MILKGLRPIRNTLPYLKSSELYLMPYIKTMLVHHNPQSTKVHEGLSHFMFWHWNQLLYSNPEVFEYRRLTPNPFIRVFMEDGSDMILDCDSRTKEEVFNQVKSILCKSDKALESERVATIDNPGNFGWGCQQNCICEIPGQIPCSTVVPLPYHMRGAYTRYDKEKPVLPDEEEQSEKPEEES